MSEVYTYTEGPLPLLISVPHDGRVIPADIRTRMTTVGLDMPDTDWHVAELYDFATAMGANVLRANVSRYVVDLNRSASDEVLYPGQLVTGLCPKESFSGDALYSRGAPDDRQKTRRVERYWRPYHSRIERTLASLHKRFGYALLWDAHSIPSRVPRLFDGELPVLNLGSNDGASCAPNIEQAVVTAATSERYSTVLNGRFKGGFITRHYGKPDEQVHALQLEIAQRAYMNEDTRDLDPQKANKLRATLRAMLETFLDAAGT